ncbi:MAG: LuxR family transcriptional regulator, partial [Parasphingorhabdus sp.]
DTARFLAELRGEEYEQLCETTALNFYRLFSKARP